MLTNDGSLDWKDYSVMLNQEFGGQSINHCSYLSGGQIAIVPGLLKACGSATHQKGSPTICEYSKANILADEFFPGLAKLIRENQTENGPCVGCRHLKTTTMARNFVSSHLHSISLHDFCGCNSHCVYCAGSEYQLPEKYIVSFDHEALFKTLLNNRIIKANLTSVSWGGGEPTLLYSFDNTVDFLRKNQIHQTINTSGIKFSLSIEKVLSERIASVCISVDSGTAEIYAKVKRNPYFDNVWENIRRYAQTGGDFVAKYIVFSLNSDVEEVESFVNRCRQTGVNKICISVDARSVYSIENGAKEITQKELVAATTMYNLALSKKIIPEISAIWLPNHIDKIKQLCHIPPSKKLSILVRIIHKIKRLVSL